MADRSKIEWCDRSDWNCIRGCTRISDGCTSCYAEAIAGRFSGPGQPFDGFAKRTPAGARWTGKVELIEARLTLPLKWRKPAHIFVNSAYDLFHEAIPDSVIDRVFAVMALCPRHIFQVLTKRSKRMREYSASSETSKRVWAAVCELVDQWYDGRASFRLPCIDESPLLYALAAHGARWGGAKPWPLRNIWKGVSCEDQQRADALVAERSAG